VPQHYLCCCETTGLVEIPQLGRWQLHTCRFGRHLGLSRPARRYRGRVA
jgi:hypothetical protein